MKFDLINIITRMSRERLLVYSSVLLSILMVLLRIAYAGTINNLFLIWNLFLAFLPLAFSKRLLQYQAKQKGIFKLAFWFVLWLLFVPNSAYILTDFTHLSLTSFLFWFDILMFFSIAFTGLFLGSLSFYHIHTFLLYYIKREHVWPVMMSLTLLSGFGIYVGRFWRWNSWEVFSQPWILFEDFARSVGNAVELRNILFFTIAYGMFQFFIYLMLYVIKGRIYVPVVKRERTLKFAWNVLRKK